MPFPRDPARLAASGILAAGLLAGCSDGMSRIDRRVDGLLAESSSLLGDPVVPRVESTSDHVPDPFPDTPSKWTDNRPRTLNPEPQDLPFTVAGDRDTAEVIARLDGYGSIPTNATRLDLPAALDYAVTYSREYKFASETYIIQALRLLSERHLWGPRFFNQLSASITADSDRGLYDTALNLVNEFQVTQRLPYGGEVSASVLAFATEDLHQRVAGENVNSADIILAADVPLLRGAGQVAREPRIQQERNMVYAARGFARFRREFLFDVSTAYLDVVVAARRVQIDEKNVENFQRLEDEQDALYREGRNTPFNTGEARNRTLDAIERLNATRENYRLAVDQFKLLLGFPVAEALVIEPDALSLPTPEVDIAGAVRLAMSLRLDLQTTRDQVEDARRGVDNARNAMLGDLDVRGSVRVPTNSERERAGFDFRIDETDFEAGVFYDFPLDREIERYSLREAQIGLARAERAYDRTRDDVAIRVRGAVRGIDAALFSLRIQEASVRVAEQRSASIQADPARADIRAKSDAIQAETNARDGVVTAKRDLEVAILFYLLETGQLRVGLDGNVDLPALVRRDLEEAAEQAGPVTEELRRELDSQAEGNPDQEIGTGIADQIDAERTNTGETVPPDPPGGEGGDPPNGDDDPVDREDNDAYR